MIEFVRYFCQLLTGENFEWILMCLFVRPVDWTRNRHLCIYREFSADLDKREREWYLFGRKKKHAEFVSSMALNCKPISSWIFFNFFPLWKIKSIQRQGEHGHVHRPVREFKPRNTHTHTQNGQTKKRPFQMTKPKPISFCVMRSTSLLWRFPIAIVFVHAKEPHRKRERERETSMCLCVSLCNLSET